MVQEQIPELQKVEQFIYMGKFERALQEIEKLDAEGKLNEDGRLRSQILKSHILIDSGQPDNGLKLAKSANKGSKRTGSALTIIDALIAMATGLWRLSKLTECLAVINEAENILTTMVDDQLEFSKRDSDLKLIKGKVYRTTGDLDLALEFLENSFSTRLELGNVYATADPLNDIGIIYAQRGEFDLSLNYLRQSLKVFEDAGNKAQVVKIRNNIGMIYWQKADLDQALDFYHKALASSEELGNKRYISTVSMNIGLIHVSRGELTSALEFYQKSLPVFEELDSKTELAFCLNNIGTVYEYRGELDLALEFYQRSLAIVEELKIRQEIATSLNNIGDVLREKGDFEAATTHYERSLEIFESIGKEVDTCVTLGNLVKLATFQRSCESAEPYLERLHEIHMKEDNKFISQTYYLAKAIMLRASDRVVKRAEAQQLFQQIAEGEAVDLNLTAEAMFNLCELLLLELETSGSEEALNELNTVLKKLVNIAEDQHNYKLFVETNLLQSKAALLELDVKRARQLLSQAQQTAEEKGLQQLAMMASGEYDSLLTQISKWDSFIESEASMQERLELARIEQMVTGLIRKREVEIQERPPEEPVMLLVMAESGLTLFSRAFGDESQLDDQLVGGFLTAVTGFGAEVFSGSGAIDRIQYQDYTVASKIAESMMFCYMFKGQSYSALQKLDQFMETVQDATPIWDGLTRALRTGQTLDEPEERSLGDIITGIFEA
ncbi:MAG: tetratricopeptide repeat protein [Candidatus Hodarchaeota archaeon]